MAKVELRDCFKGKEGYTLDKLIERLVEIRDEYQCGGVRVTMLMEPTIDGETHQIEESLCDIAAMKSYVKHEYEGVKMIHLLGRSFD